MADRKDQDNTSHKEPVHVVQDSESPYNEAQQGPENSGDPRTSNAVSTPLPWGAPTDDQHPITQPQGDVASGEDEVGAPGKPERAA